MQRKVLVVSPVPTHPANSGNRVRVATILANLKSLGYCVHFVHVQKEAGDQESMISCWGDYYHPVTYHKKNISPFKKITRKISSLFNPAMAYIKNIDEWYDAGIDKAVAELDKKFNFDVVLVEYVFFSRVLECFGRDIVKIIDTHDIFSNRHRLYLENNQRPPWFSTSPRQESKGLNRADIVIAIQDEERKKLSGICRRPVITVAHSVTLVPPRPKKMTGKILYVGSRNPINIQSIIYFIQEIMPGIHQKFPDVQLVIAGSVCDELHVSQSYIDQLGRVADLSDVYAAADIVINPMLYGTGLKIKNIEALGYSKPLITTPVGAEGMEAGSRSAFCVADSSSEWGKTITRLLKDESLCYSLSQKAYKFAKNWNRVVRENLSAAIEYKK